MLSSASPKAQSLKMTWVCKLFLLLTRLETSLSSSQSSPDSVPPPALLTHLETSLGSSQSSPDSASFDVEGDSVSFEVEIQNSLWVKLFLLLTRLKTSLNSSQSSPDLVPPPANSSAFDIEMQQQNLRVFKHNWANMIISYCFSSPMALLPLHFQLNPTHVTLAFYFLLLSILAALSMSLLSLALRSRLPNLAGITEQIGLWFAALSMFIGVSMMVPHSIRWVLWPIFVIGSLLSLILGSAPQLP